MISVTQARNIILRNAPPLKEFETLSLPLCLERSSAADIKARENIPPFNNSAMDGFALRSEDAKGASAGQPKVFEIIADLPAGHVSNKTIRNGQAIRIMTGAPLPGGADSVVMAEDTKKLKAQGSKLKAEKFVEILKEVKKGENVRYAGEDIKKNEIIVEKGTILNPGHIGVLASLGFSKVKVARKPKIAILATGDELVEIKSRLEPGKIRNSNAYALYAQVVKTGGLPILIGIARDTKKDLARKIEEGLRSDMLLVSGGISVGDYDLVKDVLVDLGVEMKFWKVAMRPGKPLAFGRLGDKLVFGLPGNPVSSMVCFEIFVRSAIFKMSGSRDDREEVEAILDEDIVKKKGLRYFLRAKTYCHNGNFFTKTTGPQGSAILRSMAQANSLIVLPEEAEVVKSGTKVLVKFFT